MHSRTTDRYAVCCATREALLPRGPELEALIPIVGYSGRLIGGETFASPGTSDEKVYYCAAPAALDAAKKPRGDGSVMEEHARVVVCLLGEAIERCRTGEIPDMKTEIALLRLADHLGYLPQLGCFADELPPELRARHRALGVAPRSARS